MGLMLWKAHACIPGCLRQQKLESSRQVGTLSATKVPGHLPLSRPMHVLVCELSTLPYRKQDVPEFTSVHGMPRQGVYDLGSKYAHIGSFETCTPTQWLG